MVTPGSWSRVSMCKNRTHSRLLPCVGCYPEKCFVQLESQFRCDTSFAHCFNFYNFPAPLLVQNCANTLRNFQKRFKLTFQRGSTWSKFSSPVFTRFCGLLQFPGATRTKSSQQLCIFLCHKYPQVRNASIWICSILWCLCRQTNILHAMISLIPLVLFHCTCSSQRLNVRPNSNQNCHYQIQIIDANIWNPQLYLKSLFTRLISIGNLITVIRDFCGRRRTFRIVLS